MADAMDNQGESNDEKKALKNHADVSQTMSELNDKQESYNDASYVHIIDEKNLSDSTDRSPDSNEFACLKKEDLLKYANDPFWIRVRIALLVLFGLAWFVMLGTAIAIIVLAPKCPPQPNLDWWQKAVVYHIHPQSFRDSNKDGYGDIKGIAKKIDYLKELNVKAICIGPMNPSPNFDYGYNIANFNTTCPHHYGSFTDLENLKTALQKEEIKLLLDFIPNHTSRSHKWFKDSSQPVNVSSPFKDYYIWHPGRVSQDGVRQPPNNWLSVYGGSAWTFHEKRQEYYYHAFSEDEPDLNLRNEAVVAALDASLKVWLNRGIDGFRFYATQYLVESANLTEDEPASNNGAKPGDYDSLIHDHTTFQRESYELVVHWRKLLDDFSHNDGKAKSRYYPRFMIVEVNGTTEQTIPFASKSTNGTYGAHIATNKALLKVKSGCEAKCVYDLVTKWYDAAQDVWSNWQLGNVDASRVATRVGSEKYISAFNMILLTLPGTIFVYYGEELGMRDLKIDSSCSDTVAVNNSCRLVNRSPMQWSGEGFAGFTYGNQTWLAVNEDYHTVNVEAQQAHGAGISPLSVFRSVSSLRQKPSILWGKFYPFTVSNVFFFIRHAEGFPGYLVAVNLGPKPSTVDFTSAIKEQKFSLPNTGKVISTTGHFDGPGRAAAFDLGTDVKLNSVFLKDGEGIVLEVNVDA